MQPGSRNRLTAALEGLSPRARQWLTIGALGGAAVGVLWAVFALGSDDAGQVIASRKTDLKPTNVDLIAPGAQVKPEEVWIGKAGRELDQYKSDRDEQRRINRERQEQHDALMRRFAELEEKLKATAAVEAPRPASAPAAPPPVVPAQPFPTAPVPAAAAFPPGLPPPPPPPGRSLGMPLGTPADEQALLARPALVRVTLAAPQPPPSQGSNTPAQTLDTFLPVSFTRGVLLGGLDAPTGGQAQTNPHPVLIRLSDNSVLPNRYRAEYRECFVIAAGYGDISSERAYLRTETLSCIRADGTALEVRIQGSVYGEDGKVGMRGRLVTKQGQMLANALLAGVVSGIGQGISTVNSTYSTSAFGSVATTSGQDAMRAGLGAGVGKALDRLAQYYIKLAEQTFPIIEIDAGREIDVVLTRGVRIEASGAGKAEQSSSGEPARRVASAVDDED